jgi:hypothetical protein
MNLIYKLEAKHFQDFNLACSREIARVNGVRGQVLWGIVVGSTIAAAGSLAWAMTDDFMAFIMFFAGAWFFWLINYVTSLYVARRAASLAFRVDGLVLGDRGLSLDDEGVHVKSDLFRQDFLWKAIRSVSVQHLVMVLWTEAAAGIFIPRSAFATPDDEQRFVSFAKSRVAIT